MEQIFAGIDMEIKETVKKLLQEMVVPDLSSIRDENSKILAVLEITNKRLDDVNTHLSDQSRRIDELRSELGQRIDDTNKRIDDTNKRIDEVRLELGQRIDDTNKRIDEVHSDLINRIDANNARIDQFFQTSVTRNEHFKVDERLTRLENEVHAIRQQLAA